MPSPAQGPTLELSVVSLVMVWPQSDDSSGGPDSIPSVPGLRTLISVISIIAAENSRITVAMPFGWAFRIQIYVLLINLSQYAQSYALFRLLAVRPFLCFLFLISGLTFCCSRTHHSMPTAKKNTITPMAICANGNTSGDIQKRDSVTFWQV
jgi:hypothetical protein